jgi:AraC-like DNA-binding protein
MSSKHAIPDLNAGLPDGGSERVIIGGHFNEAPLSEQWHAHKRGQCFGVHRGVMQVRTPVGGWILPPGYALWIPPGCHHAVSSHVVIAGWGIYPAARLCGGMPKNPRVIAPSALFREAVHRMAGWPQTGELTAAQHHIVVVVLDELRAAEAAPFHLPIPTDPRLAAIAAAIAGTPSERRTIDAWARWGGFSKRTLTRRFASETGITLAQWRERARLCLALERLSLGEKVTSVAFDLDYDSVSSFIQMFRRYFNDTPGRYFAHAADALPEAKKIVSFTPRINQIPR